jgi:two-component system, NtrC family, response regulator GlrR
MGPVYHPPCYAGEVDPHSTRLTRVVSRGAQHVRVLACCTLDATLPDGRHALARLDRPIFRVGSHETNDLVVDDPTVSKHHLEIEVTPDGYRVTDLCSSNGTLLGGLRVGTLTVIEPVELALGNVRLAIMPGAGEIELPATEDDRFGRLIGRAPVMRELFDQLARVAASDCAVVLEGETGTGKETVARSLHEHSARAGGPFVVVECASLQAELMEDELFGHVRGAFTGADSDRAGLLEAASGGTLFLDEVGDLSMPLQAKFLGVLSRLEVRRLGGANSRPVDLRVIAASQRNLAVEVNRGRFRSDLFYRLAVVRLTVPPLRDRREDIPLLIGAFLAAARARGVPGVPDELSAVALARLQSQPWAGNVRELRNTLDRIVLRLPGEEPDADTEQPQLFTARERALFEFERGYFEALLATHGGNVSAVARAADLDRRYLARILKRLGL